ncbi:MAG: DUF2304 domain-containing protein [Bacteroidota bacterium]
MVRIQIIAIAASLLFLFYIARLIVKGKLSEEYSFVWIASTFILILFSFWRNGLEVIAHLLGVFEAPNLVFTGAIFSILIYLLHLSVVVSKLHAQNKQLAQEIAMLKEKMEKK